MNQFTRLMAIITLIASTACFSQSVEIARWGNDATGAYSIDSDDGPWTDYTPHHAALSSRGLYATFAIIPSHCSRTDWNFYRTCHTYGHEFANHTWDHLSGYATNWDAEQRAWDVDSAQKKIEEEIGVRPYWYVYVSDVYNSTAHNYIRSKGYIGACGGEQGEYDDSETMNDYNISDGIQAGFCCMDDGVSQNNQITRLNGLVNNAISAGGWGIRMIHGIDDNDWGEITSTAWTTHLDYVVTKVNAGQIWNETCGNVYRYIREREDHSIDIASSNSDSMILSWTLDQSLDTAVYNYPLTLLVEPPSGYEDIEVKQNGSTITFTEPDNSTIMFDANPNNGDIIVRNGSTSAICCPSITSAGVSRITLSSTPNPFFRATNISYSLTGKERNVKLGIYNAAGALVKTFSNTPGTSGTYTVKWNGTDRGGRILPNGVYLCKLNAGQNTFTEKIMLLR